MILYVAVDKDKYISSSDVGYGIRIFALRIFNLMIKHLSD